MITGEQQFRLIEAEKRELYNHLDRSYPADSLAAVSVVAKSINKILADWVAERILDNIPLIVTGAERRERTHTFLVNSKVYTLSHTIVDLLDPAIMPFVIAPRIPEEDKPKPNYDLDIPIRSIGQYKSVRVTICPDLDFSEELLEKLCMGLLSSGYAWLSNRISFCVRIETAKISTSLYDYIRAMVGEENEEILDGFVFSCVFGGSDFVILDPKATAGALKLAGDRAYKYQRSAGGLVLQMLSEIIPVKNSVIKDICESTEEYVDVKIDFDSKYYRSGEEFLDALAAVWGDSMTCYPIVRSGRFQLVAFFGAAGKEPLVPILTQHKEELAARANEQATLIGEHLKVLQNALAVENGSGDAMGRYEWWAKIGGVFVGEALGRILHPHKP